MADPENDGVKKDSSESCEAPPQPPPRNSRSRSRGRPESWLENEEADKSQSYLDISKVRQNCNNIFKRPCH